MMLSLPICDDYSWLSTIRPIGRQPFVELPVSHSNTSPLYVFFSFCKFCFSRESQVIQIFIPEVVLEQ